MNDHRSEYAGDSGPNYLTPDGAPRTLSVAERARLMRSAGMRPGEPESPRELEREFTPSEYGIRVN
jgi:hypothetical protein